MVLMDGELCREAPIAEMEPPERARGMVGREPGEIFPPKRKAVGPVVLEVKGLSSPGAFTDVSFTVREGEIVGFAGLVGAGRTQIAEALMGLRPSSGVVRVGGKDAKARNAEQAVRRGFGYLSEDRQGSGILTGFGIAENMTLVSLRDYSSLPFVIDRNKELAKARTWRDRFGIKAGNLEAPLESLSGGNQQKVFLAKTLDPGPRVVIVDEPTRGVDVAAKQEIYRFLAELAEKGAAVVLISSELEEIIGMCHRGLGMTYVIVSGGIDLSVGSMAAFVGCLAILVLNGSFEAGWPEGTAVAAAVVCAIFAGLACGLANGLLVTKGRIAPFIVTLGSMALFRSLSLYMANAGEFRSASSLFGELGSSAPLGIPLPAFILVGLAAALAFIFGRTRYGRYTRAVGSNSRVALYSAIDVDTTRLAAYTVTGAMVGVSSVLISMRFNSVGSSTLGVNYELDAIAARSEEHTSELQSRLHLVCRL